MDLLLRIYWLENRVTVNRNFLDKNNKSRPVSLDADVVDMFWFPDIYIRQMKNMKLMEMFYKLRSMKLFNTGQVVFKMS